MCKHHYSLDLLITRPTMSHMMSMHCSTHTPCTTQIQPLLFSGHGGNFLVSYFCLLTYTWTCQWPDPRPWKRASSVPRVFQLSSSSREASKIDDAASAGMAGCGLTNSGWPAGHAVCTLQSLPWRNFMWTLRTAWSLHMARTT